MHEDGEVARVNLVQVCLRGEVVAAAPIWSVCRRGCRSAVAMVVRRPSFAEAWWCASDLLQVKVARRRKMVVVEARESSQRRSAMEVA